MVKNGLGRYQDTLNSKELEYYQKVHSLRLKAHPSELTYDAVCLCISVGLYSNALFRKIEYIVLFTGFDTRFKLRNTQPRYRDMCDTMGFVCGSFSRISVRSAEPVGRPLYR